ncbi:MAG: glycogen-binding domain-containing protein [Acidobacteriota bacterium]|nr:glycogen-binding domain-containing protein [Acidobacteriota bacterium]
MPTKSTPKRKRVTFTFDAEAGREILVAGSFNDWATNSSDKKAKVKVLKEDKKNNGHYSLNMFLTPGEYEYKFFDGREWYTDPNAEVNKQNNFGTFNSIINVA